MVSHTLELELLSYHRQETYRENKGILLLSHAKTSKVPDVSPQLLAYLRSPHATTLLKTARLAASVRSESSFLQIECKHSTSHIQFQTFLFHAV